MSDTTILETRNITKAFFGVTVLSGIDLTIKKGELHALMGENGAGKSTLMKIIMGIYKSDAGELLFEGKVVEIKEARDALHMGISMIHQELNPILDMTVAENIFVGREPKKMGILNRKQLNDDTKKLLVEFNMADVIKPTMKMRELNIAQIQMIEIIKAVSYNAKVIIMDEPTSSLSSKEAVELFRTIEWLKQRGVGIIYISHRMEEVMTLADRVSVLRDGRLIGCMERNEMNRDQIISMMVGRELSSGYPTNDAVKGEVVLELKDFTQKGAFEHVNLKVHAGEILGIAGLVGAGRSEVMRALVGYDRLDSGEVFLSNEKVVIKHPKDAKACHIAFASEDRKALGLVLCRNIRENISLLNSNLFSKAGFINKQKEKQQCENISKEVAVKMNSIEDTIENLSGGNQQKVVLAKCLLSKPKVLILDEPTRGIDVGAKASIYNMMIELARKGIAIIMISSEMPELIGMSDRIMIMAAGKMRGEVTEKTSSTQEDIIKLALGGM